MKITRMDDAERIDIKNVHGRIIERIKPKVAAGVSTRINRPGTFGEYADIAHLDKYFLAMDVGVELDRWLIARGERPSFGDDYAARIDHLLIQLPPGDGASDAVAERAARSAEEMGLLMAGIYRALGDGRITGAEARPLLATIRDLMLELQSLAEQIRAATTPDEDEE
jgi:hypothetical protein